MILTNARRAAPALCLFAGLIASFTVLGLGRDIIGPPGSELFGFKVAWLPNGNLVVSDPGFDAPGPVLDVGAVYLFSADGSRLSTITGEFAGASIGTDIHVLASGDFVIGSRLWDNPETGATSAGAATWRSGTDTVDAVVSSANSLVGRSTDDQVSSGGVVALENGNYLVLSPQWSAPGMAAAGAITWGDGFMGTSGAVAADNSVVGSAANDALGDRAPIELATGNVVVVRPNWTDGVTAGLGAVRLVSGTTPTAGPLTPSNSLVGSSQFDQIGGGLMGLFFRGGIQPLPNGNFLVRSPFWDNGSSTNAGAVTFVDGQLGTIGTITAQNSLIGSSASDFVGLNGSEQNVVALPSSNFIVLSGMWKGPQGRGQAATFGSADSGVNGVVDDSNSLIGRPSASGTPGSLRVSVLANGNYLVHFPEFVDSSQTLQQALTWGDGISGTTGLVGEANSLLGNFLREYPLTNGAFVVADPDWGSGGANQLGALTWFDGTGPISGMFDQLPLFSGSSSGDRVGSRGIFALSNGNYVVASPEWQSASNPQDMGAITWMDGSFAPLASVSSANSLIGNFDDSPEPVVALSNGNYVVRDRTWGDSRGKVIWVNGASRASGSLNDREAITGDDFQQQVGRDVIALSNGDYLVVALGCRSIAFQRGAISWRSGRRASSGSMSPENSLCGTESSFDLSDISEVEGGSYFGIWGERFAPASTDGGSVGQLSDDNSIDLSAGLGAPLSRSFDPTGQRWAFGLRDSNTVRVVNLSEIRGQSFRDGFEG